jgi:hypothetical protein
MAHKATLPTDTSLDSILNERRKFECPPQFAEKALGNL